MREDKKTRERKRERKREREKKKGGWGDEWGWERGSSAVRGDRPHLEEISRPDSLFPQNVLVHHLHRKELPRLAVLHELHLQQTDL